MSNTITNLLKPISQGRPRHILDVRPFESQLVKPPRIATENDMFVKQEQRLKEFNKKNFERFFLTQKGGTELP